MSIERMIYRTLHQAIALWSITAGNDGYGTPTFAAGVEVACRWEDKEESVTRDDAKDVVSNARIYTLEDIHVEDRVYPMTPGGSVPSTPINERWIVLHVEKMPSLKGGKYTRIAYLGRVS